jgi:hypothetical protein
MCLPSRSRFGHLLIAMMVAIQPGCGGKPGPARAVSGATGASSPAIVAPPVADFSDEECRVFAAELERALEVGDLATAGRLIDWDTLLDTSLSGLSSPEQPHKVIAGIRASAATSKEQLLNNVISQIKQGGSYKFVRVRQGADGKRIQFRLLMAEGGLNYHEIVVGRKEGRPIGIDMYVCTSGELLSQTLRRMAVLGLSVSDTSVLKRLQGTDSEFSRHAGDCVEMIKSFKEQRFGDCLAAYERLSPSLKREKAFMLIQIFASSSISDEMYIAAIDRFRAAHPDEACIDLIAIDSYMLKKDYQSALQAVEQLDKAVGGDPYLRMMRGNIYFAANEFQDAEREALQAIAEDAGLVDAWWIRINVSMKQRAFGRTAELLTKIQQELNVEIADLTTIPEYAEFVKSDEYQKWLADQRETP